MDLNVEQNQWVCLRCGFNIIGKKSSKCPFCGAPQEEFIAWDEAEKKFTVTETRLNEYVTQLLSVPRLGLEHAAYRVETTEGTVLIDCPSAFNRSLAPVKRIFFTHCHFMGASNQYRSHWGAAVHMHEAESQYHISDRFPVDDKFTDSFSVYGIEAFHIGGHTKGFTIYIYDKVVFVCDYAFPPGPEMKLNPFGHKAETKKNAGKIYEILKGRDLNFVCGVSYIEPFRNWLDCFKKLI